MLTDRVFSQGPRPGAGLLRERLVYIAGDVR